MIIFCAAFVKPDGDRDYDSMKEFAGSDPEFDVRPDGNLVRTQSGQVLLGEMEFKTSDLFGRKCPDSMYKLLTDKQESTLMFAN